MVEGGKTGDICCRHACVQGVCQSDQDWLRFTGDNRIGDRPLASIKLQQIVAVEPGVEAEEAEVGVRIRCARLPRRVHADAQRSVHGYGNGDQVGAGRSAGWELLDGQVGSCGVKGGFPEGGQRPGQAERLMAEFVAGDQQD